MFYKNRQGERYHSSHVSSMQIIAKEKDSPFHSILWGKYDLVFLFFHSHTKKMGRKLSTRLFLHVSSVINSFSLFGVEKENKLTYEHWKLQNLEANFVHSKRLHEEDRHLKLFFSPIILWKLGKIALLLW